MEQPLATTVNGQAQGTVINKVCVIGMVHRMVAKLKNLSSSQKRTLIVPALVIVGLITLVATKAATPTASIEPEGGVKTGKYSVVSNANASAGSAVRFGNPNSGSCGKYVQNYTYQVPYGNAIWNQPICGKPRHPRSSDYAERFYKWANLNDGSAAGQQAHGKVGVDIGIPTPLLTDPEGLTGNFSRNVYYASNATTQTKIQASVYYSNLDGNLPYGDYRLNLPDSTIPWNPEWKTGAGGDNEIVILDDRPGSTQGRIYNISGYKWGLFAVSQCGPFFREERICTYSAGVGRDLDGNYIDYRTYEGFNDERGVGLSMYATFVTPEEVKAGEIRHAMGMAIPNTAYGTICSKAQQGTAAEGTTCGTAVAPATKFEWGGVQTPPSIPESLKSIYGQDKHIPEGMIFAIDITEPQIDAWISSQDRFTNDPVKANTARIFARAIRDYGLMVADTSGAGAGIQVAGAVNPIARQQWAELGIDSYDDSNLLDGLITSTNLYVVNPPLATCKDGTTSRYYCEWTSTRYGN